MMSINGIRNIDRDLHYLIDMFDCLDLPEEETGSMDFKPYPTQPGDIIYFDSYAPHKSSQNLTDRARRLYFSTYNRLSEGNHLEAYYSDKRKNFPPDIEREVNKNYVYKV